MPNSSHRFAFFWVLILSRASAVTIFIFVRFCYLFGIFITTFYDYMSHGFSSICFFFSFLPHPHICMVIGLISSSIWSTSFSLFLKWAPFVNSIYCYHFHAIIIFATIISSTCLINRYGSSLASNINDLFDHSFNIIAFQWKSMVSTPLHQFS